MKNKEGFTIVELTVSITLILLLAVFLVPNLLKMGDNSKEKMYDSKIQMALSGAYKYGIDNVDELSNECTDVTIGTLINLEYISGDDDSGYKLMDPVDGGNMNNIVICVYYEKNEVRAKVKK